MRGPIRAGVVGAGNLGQHHARIYASRADVELVAVVDRDPGRAGEVSARTGARPGTDFRELLGQLDVVSVAVPTVLHHEVAAAFLTAGAHVLVEKPIARTLEQADSLVEEAERADRILHVGHTERFNPAVRAARPLIRHARFIDCQRLGTFAPRSLDVDVVLDLMIHDLDVILSLVPVPLARIDAVGVNALTDKLDIANARLRFADGAVANLTASRISAGPARKLRIFQPESYLSVDYSTRRVQHYVLRRPRGGAPEITATEVPVEAGEPLALEIDAFLRAAAGGPDEGVRGPEGRHALDVALQVLDAIHEDRPGP